MRVACLVCGTPTSAGAYCPRHTLLSGNTSTHWRRTRAARLLLDGGYCQLRHDGCTGRATTVHLAPRLHGDHHQATVETCISACHHCHGVEDAPRATGYPAAGGGGGGLEDRSDGLLHPGIVAATDTEPGFGRP